MIPKCSDTKRSRRPVLAFASVALLGASQLAAQAPMLDPIAADRQIHLRCGSFDPAVAAPAPAASWRSAPTSSLWIVQFDGLSNSMRRAALRARGAVLASYLPENAHVVRFPASKRASIEGLSFVRALLPYHAAFRVDPALIAQVDALAQVEAAGPLGGAEIEVNMLLVDRVRDRAPLVAKLARLGAIVDPVTAEGSGLLVRARVRASQVAELARLDEVLWLDRHAAPELDMDNARAQGGAQALDVAVAGKYRGKGVAGHVFEGVEISHPDFATPPTNFGSNGGASAHGHCVAGIVFGRGQSGPAALGLVPEARCYFTEHTSMSATRGTVLRDVSRLYNVMFTTSAWGYGRTTEYSSVSADVDAAVFETDVVWTQSFSGGGTQLARPEAWGKNVISVGSVAHGDNALASDDSWLRGRANHGPAADGRIKPDLVAYDDSIHCSDLSGALGYASGNTFTSFGGTSGATAIVSGYNAIAMQMFADGLFSPKRKPSGTVYENRPHASTTKALQIASARQYAFNSTSSDNRREHCGWGFPDVKRMYDDRALHFVVDETEVLRQGDGVIYRVDVPQGQSELRVVLAFTDPAANPTAARARVNDVSMRVTAPDSTSFWGRNGLMAGNASVPGGSRDVVDTVECVIIPTPAAGTWEIEVGAWLVAQDGHVETTADDVDFGLVVAGATYRDKRATTVPVGSFDEQGAGCPDGPGCTTVVTSNWAQQSAQRSTTATRIAILEWRAVPMTLCGLEFYFGAKSGTEQVKASLYSTHPVTALPEKELASATLAVSALGAYKFDFSNPVALAGTDLYFLVIDNTDKLELPVSPFGETGYHHSWNGSSWASALFDTKWQYRIHGISGRVAPALSGEGEPRIGKTFSFVLSKARASSTGLLFFGASDTQWGALQLPFEYVYPCSLQVSGELAIPFTADSEGEARIPLPIPMDPKLVGFTSYHQFLVADPQNRVGVIVSNAARLRIGL